MIVIVLPPLSDTPTCCGLAVATNSKATPELSQNPWNAVEVYSVPFSPYALDAEPQRGMAPVWLLRRKESTAFSLVLSRKISLILVFRR